MHPELAQRLVEQAARQAGTPPVPPGPRRPSRLRQALARLRRPRTAATPEDRQR